ncbi:hypothetical protein, partial [Nostoc parmelioides]
MSKLTGITNENEFYSNHYLDAILNDDIKGVAQRWREAAAENETKSPPELLGSLAASYFRFINNRTYALTKWQKSGLIKSIIYSLGIEQSEKSANPRQH